MSAKQPFMPHYGTNQVLAAGAASLNATIATGDDQVRIANTGANKAYVQTYNSMDQSGTTASAADLVILAGQSTTITKDQMHDTLAYFSAAGTNLEVITGRGW